jgi:hypothetical protein
MPVFYSEAIAAANILEGHRGRVDQIPSLDSWQDVARELDKLSPAAQCHAIYADWLLQLHKPGGDTQIQIRNLLLGQRALDANYLAEFAQNADDAGALALEVRLEDGWLLVANSGCSLSPLNLLGLCRFFIHSDGQIVGLTEQTIGKFGIGFKSCHNVSEEVVIQTWGRDGTWGFRLPISESRTAESLPRPELLQRIADALAEVGSSLGTLREQHLLGHCTPESLNQPSKFIPESIAKRVEEFRSTNRNQGVAFALRIRTERYAETEKRVQTQLDAVYELCPLFLNNLRLVSLQGRHLRMVMGEQIGTDNELASARRVTLEIKTDEGETRNDRVIALSPKNKAAKWRIALPADSDTKLKAPSAEQYSLRSGGAYAFFPLQAVNAQWPWTIHLHLSLDTNLARSDWNTNNQHEIESELGKAAHAAAVWSSANQSLWHVSWQPCDVLSSGDHNIPANTWAGLFKDTFSSALKEQQSIRTLWDGYTTTAEAKGLQFDLLNGDIARQAWSRLAGIVPDEIKTQYALVLLTNSTKMLGIAQITTRQCLALYSSILPALQDADIEVRQAFLTAVMATDALVERGYVPSELIGDAIATVKIDRPGNLDPITLKEAADYSFDVRLTPEWHEYFRKFAGNWLSPNSRLAGQTVFGFRVREMLLKLQRSVDIPTGWDEVAQMCRDDFRLCGERFWMMSRTQCPEHMAATIIDLIYVDSSNGWRPLPEVWLGREPVQMLHPILHSLRKPDELNNSRALRMERCLQAWGLYDAYQEAVLLKIAREAKDEFQRRLTEAPGMSRSMHALIQNPNWRPENLPLAWQLIVKAAAKSALIAYCEQNGFGRWRGHSMLVGPAQTLKILSWLPEHVPAPVWMDEIVAGVFVTMDIFKNFSIELKLVSRLTVDQRAEYGELLLRNYRRWCEKEIDDSLRDELCAFFASANGNWTIGYPGSTDQRLNEHCDWLAPSKPAETSSPWECILAGHSTRQFEGGKPLPLCLAEIPELRRKTISLELFSYSGPDTEQDCMAMAEGELSEELLQNPWFSRLRELLPTAPLVAYPGYPNLQWRRSGMNITVRRAQFAAGKWDGSDVIFVSDPTKVEVSDGPDYRPVLYAYSLVAPEDHEVNRATTAGRGLRKVYRNNRDKVFARLVQAYATDWGYEAEHVLRELLQNAESAYASRVAHKQPDIRSFEVLAKEDDGGASWSVIIRHHGRAFNEADCEGNSRKDDIDRLCAIAAIQNRTGEEVGRFNRGFKSIFQVTNRVEVRSGLYEFRVEDMFLLSPPQPEPHPENEVTDTCFRFKVDTAKAGQMVRKLRNKDRPFLRHELVFLRHVETITLELPDSGRISFSITRAKEDSNGWRHITINELPGHTSYYWVRNERIAQGMFAVALECDAGGRPLPINAENRFLYRTFPLQQHSEWASFWINAEFITDHGRANLKTDSQNGIFIREGIRAVLDFVRDRVELSQGDIEQWVAWVKWLNLKELYRCRDAIDGMPADVDQLFDEFGSWLLSRLPAGNKLVDCSEVTFPSRLVRRIAKRGDSDEILRFDTSTWIDERVMEALSYVGDNRVSLLQLRNPLASHRACIWHHHL